MSIGIFDSGVGGLTVLKEALLQMPNEAYIYYADTDHVPYGVKPKDEVKKYIFEAADFFAAKKVEALIVACNTATSIAINDLRDRYSFPIIGMEPAVKPAVEKVGGRRVLVLATPITVREKKLYDLVHSLDSEDIVDLHALPGLVEFAENFVFDEDVVIPYLLEEFGEYNLKDYGAVVLGCTHFVFYRKHFSMILPPGIDIIDGNIGTVNRLRTLLKGRRACPGKYGSVEFYSSGRREKDGGIYKRYLKLDY